VTQFQRHRLQGSYLWCGGYGTGSAPPGFGDSAPEAVEHQCHRLVLFSIPLGREFRNILLEATPDL
jgi:hypothetical protein